MLYAVDKRDIMTRMGVFILMPRYYDERVAQMEPVYETHDLLRCDKCHVLNWQPSSPLIIRRCFDRYGVNAGPIGDFTWIGGMSIPLVRNEVRHILENQGTSLRFERTTISANPRWASKARKRANDDSLEAADMKETLWRVVARTTCRLDLEQSRRRIVRHCAVCGRTEYESEPGARNVVDALTWSGEPFFHIEEVGLPLFVTDAGRSFLETCNFFNLRMEPAGYVEMASKPGFTPVGGS